MIRRLEKIYQLLTAGEFDKSHSSKSSKEVQPHGRHAAPRGELPMRALGHYKPREGAYMKRCVHCASVFVYVCVRVCVCVCVSVYV